MKYYKLSVKRLVAFVFVANTFFSLSCTRTASVPASVPASVTSPSTIVTVHKEQISDLVRSELLNSTKIYPAEQLRKFPFPYNAMLAITSDIDQTTLEEFETYHRFLNTREQTPHGLGLGLDIGDSAWLFNADDFHGKIDEAGHPITHSMSYFAGLDPKNLKDAEKIVYYFKAGWIDSLHSFGDFTREDQKKLFTRALATAAWDEMNKSEFKPKIWINHGSQTNTQNFGAYTPKDFTSYQAGDNPKSPYYHSDLTFNNGIRYVWDSVGKSQFGYTNPLFPISLRDGKKIWGFYRYTNDVVKGKIEWTWEPHKLSRQITRERLDNLVNGKEYSVVAQHFGAGVEAFPFDSVDIQTLRMLKTYQDDGKIVVARTIRLLNYARSQAHIRSTIAHAEGKTYINIDSIEDPVLGKSLPSMEEIRGLTFYVNDPTKTVLLLNLNPISEDEIQRNGVDGNGKESIGVKWFSPDYTDYTKAWSTPLYN